MDNAAHELGGQDMNVVTGVRTGDPGIEIVAYANEIKADLALLSHTDKGILARLFEGSVGAELLRNLPCSMLIAPHTA